MSRVAQQAVTEYFDVLLTEAMADEPDPLKQAQVAALLADIADNDEDKSEQLRQLKSKGEPEVGVLPPAAVPEEQAEVIIPTPEPEKVVVEQVPEPVIEKAEKSELKPKEALSCKEFLDDNFQCLFFRFSGLTIAVPLELLGGIKQLDSLTRLPGSPDWMLGVQSTQDESWKVVDSEAWIMPESEPSSPNYRYLVQLGNSGWALACEDLIEAEPISKSEVKWRLEGAQQRRHLAGIVRERMCVVLDVTETIGLLDAGMNSTLEES